MKADALRVHAFLESSYANGPGRRAVLWLQGCTLGCPGCFNPHTHAAQAGDLVSIDQLFDRISDIKEIEGITISGGEPLQQLWPLLGLLERLRRETCLSIILFTGYTETEIGSMPQASRLPACVDVLIAGRYLASQRLAQGLAGSANKTLHFYTRRYTVSDFQDVPPAEVILSSNGDLLLSGIDPLKFEDGSHPGHIAV